MNVQEVLNDRTFIDLPPQEKQKVLQKIDPNFAALPEGEQNKVVIKLSGQAEPDEVSFSAGARINEQSEEPTADWAKDYPNLYGLAGVANEILGPMAEMGGLVAGSTLGMTAGGPVGGLVGGGMGYAAGHNVQNRLNELVTGQPQYSNMIEAATDTGNDFVTGAKYELAGQLIAPVAGKIIQGSRYAKDAIKNPIINTYKRGLPGTDRRAQIEAGEQLLARQPHSIKGTDKSKLNYKLIDDALERTKSPRLTNGQMTDNFQQRAFEQSRMTKNTELGSRVVARNNEVLKAAEDTINKQINETIVGKGLDNLQYGDAVRSTIKTAFDAEKQMLDDAWAALPKGIKVSTAPFRKEMLKILRDMSKAQERKTIKSLPNNTISQMMKAVRGGKNKTMNIDSLRAWRSRISNEAQVLSESGNFAAARRMKQLRSALDKGLDSATGVPQEYAAQYREARKLTGEFKGKFETGESGRLLGYGDNFGGTKIRSEEIPSKFFGNNSLTSANQLKTIVGEENAKLLYKDYATDNVYKNLSEGNMVKVKQFIIQNKKIMKLYGVKPKDIISPVELKNILLEGNAAGQVTLSKLHSRMTDLKKSGILNTVYSKEQVQSLDDYHALLQAVQRNKNVSASGGSSTADKLAGDAKKTITGGVAQLVFLRAKMGFYYQSTKNILNSLATAIGSGPEAKITKILEDAIYDPKLATQVMNLAKGNKQALGSAEIQRYLVGLQKQALKPQGIGYPQRGYGSLIARQLDKETTQ